MNQIGHQGIRSGADIPVYIPVEQKMHKVLTLELSQHFMILNIWEVSSFRHGEITFYLINSLKSNFVRQL